MIKSILYNIINRFLISLPFASFSSNFIKGQQGQKPDCIAATTDIKQTTEFKQIYYYE